MAKIDLNKLSAKELKELEQQIAERNAAEEAAKEKYRAQYKELVHKTTDEIFGILESASKELSVVKKTAFESFETLIEMKKELYKVKANQQSHTFSNADGSKTITLGFRVYDHYDDTVNAGIEKVREYLKSLAVDEKTGELVEMISGMMKPDKEGNLKPNRVMDLAKLAKDSDSEVFKDGVQIIMDAYKPSRSVDFIEATAKDDKGVKNGLPLSISSAPFPD